MVSLTNGVLNSSVKARNSTGIVFPIIAFPGYALPSQNTVTIGYMRIVSLCSPIFGTSEHTLTMTDIQNCTYQIRTDGKFAIRQ